MSDIDDVLERLITEPGFRAQLADDPTAALAAYSLDEDDLEILAATLDEGADAERGVEQRTSKSAFLAAFTGLAGSGGGGGGGHPDLVAPDGSEDPAARSQCKNNLKQIGIALHDEDPIQDLTSDAGPEEAEIIYPGIYVEEVPPPETGAAPPESLRVAEDEPPLPEGWPAKWSGPEPSEPSTTPDADVATPQPRIVGETGPEDPTDAPEALSTGEEGPRFPKAEIHLTAAPPDVDEVSPTDAEIASGDTDLEAPTDAVEEPSDPDAVEEPEEATTPETPQTDPAGFAAERGTQEAETVHAFIKANGTDLTGESSLAPGDRVAEASGQQDADR